MDLLDTLRIRGLQKVVIAGDGCTVGVRRRLRAPRRAWRRRRVGIRSRGRRVRGSRSLTGRGRGRRGVSGRGSPLGGRRPGIRLPANGIDGATEHAAPVRRPGTVVRARSVRRVAVAPRAGVLLESFGCHADQSGELSHGGPFVVRTTAEPRRQDDGRVPSAARDAGAKVSSTLTGRRAGARSRARNDDVAAFGSTPLARVTIPAAPMHRLRAGHDTTFGPGAERTGPNVRIRGSATWQPPRPAREPSR